MDQFNQQFSGNQYPGNVQMTPQPPKHSGRKALLVIIVLVLIGVGAWFAYSKGLFTSQPGPDTTGTENPTGSDTEQKLSPEQETIIVAIENQKKILASRDIKQIRAYLEKISQTPELKASLAAQSDEKLLESATFASQFTSAIPESALRAKSAVWKIGAERATVEVTSGNTAATFEVYKVNGVWY
jgi:hypothetical protein